MRIQGLVKCLGIFTGLCCGAAQAITFSASLDSFPNESNPSFVATTGLQTGRLNRAGFPSACGATKPNPGLFATTGDYRYDQYRFIALETGCVTVTLSDAGNNLLFGAAYSGIGLFESDPSVAYLADIASSPTNATPSRSFSFDVVAGEPFSVVIHEVSVGGGIGQSYTLDVDGIKVTPDFSFTETFDTTRPVPTPAGTGITSQQAGRLNRNGVKATCDAPKVNPGEFTNAGSRRLDSFTFTPLTSGCAVVTVSHSGMDSASVAIYDENGYSLGDITANYLADAGESAVNSSIAFSFNAQAGVPFTAVVHETNPGAGFSDEYTLGISGVVIAYKFTINSSLDNTPPLMNRDWLAVADAQLGRMNRNGVASDCGGLKTNPGLLTPAGTRRSDLYTFVPPGSGCVWVTITAPAGNLFHAAYDEMGFNSADPSINYLADSGQSPTALNPTHRMGFNVSEGVPFTVSVSEVSSMPASGFDYELIIQGNAMLPLGDTVFRDSFEN